MSPWFQSKPSRQDFEQAGLLLTQSRRGDFSWAQPENLFKPDSEIQLEKCFLTNKEAQIVVKNKALYIDEADPRLSNFELLIHTKRPHVRINKRSDVPDLVAMHLASCREVYIVRQNSKGQKSIDHISSDDYWRAKADLKKNPADTKNMQRFVNRHGPSGEGPSALDRRICHGSPRPAKAAYTPFPSTFDHHLDALEALADFLDANKREHGVDGAYVHASRQTRHDVRRARYEKRRADYELVIVPARPMPWMRFYKRFQAWWRRRGGYAGVRGGESEVEWGVGDEVVGRHSEGDEGKEEEEEKVRL
jgi:hypothetical protein